MTRQEEKQLSSFEKDHPFEAFVLNWKKGALPPSHQDIAQKLLAQNDVNYFVAVYYEAQLGKRDNTYVPESYDRIIHVPPCTRREYPLWYFVPKDCAVEPARRRAEQRFDHALTAFKVHQRMQNELDAVTQSGTRRAREDE